MPKGTECDPSREWWQGTVTYYVFVPSFQDSDGDGYGDFGGLISRLDYIQNLGFRAVRLAPIFENENDMNEKIIPTNYMEISHVLGDTKDLRLLAALLHERDMFLLLDLPLVNPRGSPIVDLENEMTRILTHWLDFGVDGFVLTDADELTDSADEASAQVIRKWRNLLDAKSHPLKRRLLCVPINYLSKLELMSPDALNIVLSSVNLIDVHLDVSLSAKQIAETIENATKWDNHPSLPWINWRIGGPFEPRVSDIPGTRIGDYGGIPTGPGFNFLPLFLPGSVTLYYGDEIGLSSWHPEGENGVSVDNSWATPMAWSQNGGFSPGGKSWLPLGYGWMERNVASSNESLDILRVMLDASQNEAPLYINGIFEDIGSYHPQKSTNYKIRYATSDLLIMDRFFPRRNKFAIVVNLGPSDVQQDLSKLYYGGKVLASSHGKEGYVRFRNIQLGPFETLVVVLDK